MKNMGLCLFIKHLIFFYNCLREILTLSPPNPPPPGPPPDTAFYNMKQPIQLHISNQDNSFIVLWILLQTQTKFFSICLTTFALFTLSNEDFVKASILEAKLLNTLLETNLFKEMNSTGLESMITTNITKEISSSTNVRYAFWNWTCTGSNTTCSDALYLSYSFNKKLSLLTHRYTETSIHAFFVLIYLDR